MCGITGFFSYRKKIDTNIYYQAHKKLSHRGPDDEGFLYKDTKGKIIYLRGDDSIGACDTMDLIYHQVPSSLILGHRRLSVIDLSEMGHQPYHYDNLSLVYNGEIYNYIELREKLKTHGYSFKTDSDTEVFLKAYHCWKDAAFNYFDGMWAAAIYYHDRDEIVLSRDRFGIKPLYYHDSTEGLVFGSEIKFLTPFLESLDVDEEMAYDFLRFNYLEHTKKTFFKNIYQLQPGHNLSFTKAGVHEYAYWNFKEKISADTLAVEKALKSAIELRLRSDVKVGTLLSGGIDSSTILGMIDSYMLSPKVDTFSALFHEEAYSEKRYIDAFKTKNILLNKHYIYPEAGQVEKDITNLLYVQEEPFRSLSVYSQYVIYKHIHAESDVTVLLNGQGADEIFSGYIEHYYYYLLELLRELDITRWIKEVRALKKDHQLSYLSIFKEIIRIALTLRYTRADKYGIFHTIPEKSYIVEKKYSAIFKEKLWEDLTFSALREYLRYEDKNSMAFSLESRLPYLDIHLVETAFALKDSDKIAKGVSKYILRKVAKGKIPDMTLQRRDKMGFVSPQELWQKNILCKEFDDVFASIKNEGLFSFINHHEITKLYQRYQEGESVDWGFIWRIYILYKWKKVWNING